MPPEPSPLPFDLRALEIFLAVCDGGGMAAGARRLGVTQPAASQAVAELEAGLGSRLFDRAVRPLALTAAGVMLRQRAAALLAEARQIEPLLRGTAAGRFALVRVGLVDSLTRATIGPLADHLGGLAEQVSFQAGLTAAHTETLLSRRLDLLLGSDELTEREGLERWPLLREPYVLALPRGMAPAGSLAAQARAAPLVRFSARSTTGLEVERYLRRLRLDVPRWLEFDAPYGATAAVAAGRGWTITTPLCLFESGLELPVDFWPLPEAGFTRTLTLVARRREFGPLPRQVAEVVRRALRDGPIPSLLRVAPWLDSMLDVPTSERFAGASGRAAEATIGSL
jgi:DNA-binding transcriptional LysR family regulator